jgi:hypothetical protein
MPSPHNAVGHAAARRALRGAAALLLVVAVVQRQRVLQLVGREEARCRTRLYAGTDAAQLPSPGPGVPVYRIVPLTPAASPP